MRVLIHYLKVLHSVLNIETGHAHRERGGGKEREKGRADSGGEGREAEEEKEMILQEEERD